MMVSGVVSGDGWDMRRLCGAAALRRDGRAIAMAVIAVASGCTVEITDSGMTRYQLASLADVLTGLQ
jgi:hypothetical protein